MANNYCQCTPGQSLNSTKEQSAKLIELLSPEDGLDESHGFTAKYYPESGFYMYAEEYMDLDALPKPFLKELGKLIEENKMPYLSFGFAITCSKMRPGEFGGGDFRVHTDGTIKYPEITWK